MRWKPVVVIACAALITMATTALAQTAVPNDTPVADQPAEPRSMRDLTRILRSPERIAELDGAVAELEAMATAGNAEAALLLGNEYIRNRGTLPLDYDKAVLHLEQAATLGMPEVNLTLADLHRKQSGGLPRARTLDYLRAAADAGLKEAFMPLATALRRGTYGDADIPLAVQYYQAALAGGEAAALPQLIAIYKAGTGGDDDGARLVDYLNMAADGGDPTAHRTLSDLYLKGAVVPQDPALAEHHLRAAIAAGDATASLALATGLMRGQFGADRQAEAVPMLQTAFDAGNTAVAASLAGAYARGRGVATDLPRALAILRRGNDAGDMAARIALFNLYVRGSGRVLAPDLPSARALYATIPQDERVGAVEANAAILAAYGGNVSDFARMWDLLKGLDTSLQGRTGLQILNVNKNAYVYMLQALLRDRGLYSGNLTGQLTTTTIAAVNQFCAQANIAAACRMGPLGRSAWNAMADALANEQK